MKTTKLAAAGDSGDQEAKKFQKRSANIDEDTIRRVISVLDNWTKPKLTWDALTDELSLSGLPDYTRQALERQPLIKSAYSSMKISLRAENGGMRSTTRARDSDLCSKIRSLERKIQRLEKENSNLLERFLRWLHNANNSGLSIEQLELPLPEIERGLPLSKGTPMAVTIKKSGKTLGNR
jgi:hypothetical protein